MNNVVIKDKSEISKLMHQFKDSLYNKTLSEAQIEQLAHRYANNGEFYLLKEGQTEIGFVSFYCNDLIKKISFISMIVVKKERQGKSYGNELIKIVENVSIMNGMTKVRLEVDIQNERALKFYQKKGFKIVEEKESSRIMEKQIR
ncbi:MAG: GNAT family N-acetyltransferase [Lachnospiraceae bacterium]|nr:GNAT family N-acetyltransferase [Lachnospiraceae bacterium]